MARGRAGPGLHPRSPRAATLHTIFRHVNRAEFEAHLGAWADHVVESLPAAPETPGTVVALDGKTLRGSKKQGAPGTHLLSALAHHVGMTLANTPSTTKPMRSPPLRPSYTNWFSKGAL